MNLITTADHAFAAAAKDIVAASRVIQSGVLPVLTKAATQASTIEAVTGLVCPAAANIERVAFALLGVIIKTLTDGTQAVVAGGLNVQLDAALVADVKAIIPAVKAQAAQLMPAAK
ncbi:MAG TPA: hypothetical protein VKF41_06645 [Bryobacteraceae bacterium]|nr:hypothetical protein [Bryobacteraceae bacterium]